jgi:hypothetical protein
LLLAFLGLIIFLALRKERQGGRRKRPRNSDDKNSD